LREQIRNLTCSLNSSAGDLDQQDAQIQAQNKAITEFEAKERANELIIAGLHADIAVRRNMMGPRMEGYQS